MTTPAAIWVRVSTGSQDESTQLRELRAYAAKRGYTVVKTIRLHDISASKGEQEEAMAEVIEDVKNGLYEVLLVDDSSRLDRRDNPHARDYFRAAVGLAGGTIESRTEPMFGKADIGGQIMTLIAAQQNADYSKKLREQVDRAVRQIVANGGFQGKRPWGWRTEGSRYSKRLACDQPDDIREMYRLASQGKNCADIGRKFGLYPETVNSIIRNTVNKGYRQCSHTFLDGSKETWLHRCEELIPEDLWRQANAQLDQLRSRPSKSGRKPKHWISGALTCAECSGGVMHAKVQEKGGKTYAYLRCAGPRATPNPKGCGNIHLLADAEKALGEFMSRATEVQVMEQRITPGNRLELAAERARLDESAAVLGTMPEAVRSAAQAALDTEYARLEATPVIDDQEELTPVGTIASLWANGKDEAERLRSRRKLLDSLDLWIDRSGTVGLEESFPTPDRGYVVLRSGLVLDMNL